MGRPPCARCPHCPACGPRGGVWRLVLWVQSCCAQAITLLAASVACLTTLLHDSLGLSVCWQPRPLRGAHWSPEEKVWEDGWRLGVNGKSYVAELCVQGLEWTAPSSVCSGIRPFFITQKTISSQYFQGIILSCQLPEQSAFVLAPPEPRAQGVSK